MNPSKAKGDRAELEVQGIFREHLGAGRRALGAGRRDDIGDITGIPDLTVQVADWQNIGQAVRHKPIECEAQRIVANTAFAASFLRLRGGVWRVVLTPEQFFELYREAVASPKPVTITAEEQRALLDKGEWSTVHPSLPLYREFTPRTVVDP